MHFVAREILAKIYFSEENLAKIIHDLSCLLYYICLK